MTDCMPWSRALQDRVARASWLLTELGDVNTCLKACTVFLSEERRRTVSLNLQKQAVLLERAPPMDSLRCRNDFDIETEAIGPL